MPYPSRRYGVSVPAPDTTKNSSSIRRIQDPQYAVYKVLIHEDSKRYQTWSLLQETPIRRIQSIGYAMGELSLEDMSMKSVRGIFFGLFWVEELALDAMEYDDQDNGRGGLFAGENKSISLHHQNWRDRSRDDWYGPRATVCEGEESI
ncbi:hypothetical protein Tco_1538765 [Tanacetum coccineum]